MTDIQPKAQHKYIDHATKKPTVKILPGEYFVTNEDECIVTVLGSCIAACIYDKKIGVGGMNHFMLPASKDGEWAGVSASTRYGNFAMEHLINDILKRGGLKQNMVAKVYGGSNFMEKTTIAVGDDNIGFARDYLRTEGIFVLEEDLGGSHSRKVTFHPQTGEVNIKKLDVTNHTVQVRDSAYKENLDHTEIAGEVTLF